MRIPWRIVVAGLLEWTVLALLLRLKPLEQHVVECIAVLLGTSALYLISCFSILKETQSKPFEGNTLVWVLGIAILLRLTVFHLPPAFTDDVLRYRWEARLQLQGASPYEVAPSDPAVANLRDETYQRISGPDFRAVYGPLTEMLYRHFYAALHQFHLGWRAEVFWLKLPSILFELGTLAGILALLKAAGQPLQRVLIYAWSPLPIVEFWINGHNDTLMLCPLVWCFALATKQQWRPAFTLLGIAVAAKVWPIALLPLLTGWPPRRWKLAGITAAVVTACILPFGLGLFRNGPFLSGFLGGWRNNDSLFGVLLWATGDPYRAKYAAFAIVAAVILWVTLKGWVATRAAAMIIAAMLLVSSNCHPWYLTWLLVWMPLHPSLGILLWAGLSPLFYQVLIGWEILGQWDGSTPLRWLVYGPVFVVLAYESLRRRSSLPPSQSE